MVSPGYLWGTERTKLYRVPRIIDHAHSIHSQRSGAKRRWDRPRSTSGKVADEFANDWAEVIHIFCGFPVLMDVRWWFRLELTCASWSTTPIRGPGMMRQSGAESPGSLLGTRKLGSFIIGWLESAELLRCFPTLNLLVPKQFTVGVLS